MQTQRNSKERIVNKKLRSIIFLALFTALAVTVLLSAQEKQDHPDMHPHYQLIDLGTLGGSYSNAFAINDKGEIAGWSTVAGDTTVHAVLWRNGNVIDLGTFGGPNSITEIFSGSSVTEKGMIPGGAETLTPDSLGEDFCFFGTNLVCLPLVRRDGELTPLPTLGDDNGFANRMNGLGEVVGLAENTTHDPSCSAPQVLQFKPDVWLNGEIHELPTVPGFPDGIATSINDKGQVVGVSANCSLSAAHALLWDHGKVTDLENLGGVTPVSGSSVPFQSAPPWLTVRMEVDGVSFDLLLDTAASGILLFQSRIRNRLQLISLGERMSSNLGGGVRLHCVILARTKFGETDFGQESLRRGGPRRREPRV